MAHSQQVHSAEAAYTWHHNIKYTVVQAPHVFHDQNHIYTYTVYFICEVLKACAQAVPKPRSSCNHNASPVTAAVDSVEKKTFGQVFC